MNAAGKVSSIDIDSSAYAIYADIETIDTPHGKLLEKVADYINFEPRLLINKNENGVIKDMEIVSIDIVAKHENQQIYGYK